MSISNLEWKLEDALRVRGQEEAEKARAKEKEEIAKKMIKRGTPFEIIAEDTELSIERVKKLAEKVNKNK